MLSNPLVLVGLGGVGHRVTRDLHSTATATTSNAPVVRLAWTGGERGQARLRTAAADALRELLQPGRARGGRATLDVLLVADVTEVPPEEPALVLDVLADLLATEWPVLFPPDAAATERSAWGTVALATPPLRGASAEPGLAALDALLAHRGRAPHPLLSRALVLPRQTTAGRLSDEAVEHSFRALGLGLYLTGARDADPVRHLLGHRDDDRFVVGLSIAAAELPLAGLRRYARWRLAWDGLDALVQRAEHPTGDPSRAEALVARLAVDSLLEPFREGEAAQRVRRHAAALSGAVDRLPADLSVKLVERDHDLRARFRVLLGPAVKPPPDKATEHPEHGEILRSLDQEEAFAAEDLDRRIERMLATELEPGTALEVLPHLEAALERAAHSLQSRLPEGPEPLPERDPPPPPTDPGRDALAAAVEGRPRIGNVLPLALAFGLVLGTVAALGTAALLVVPPGPTAAFSSEGAASTLPIWRPLAAGTGVGLLGALAFALVVLHGGRVALRDALLARRTELEGLWRRGGGGQPGTQAVALLEVRERRTVAALHARLVQARRRLADARAALRAARDHSRSELERLRVRLAGRASRDDLSGLLGSDSPLHRPLLPSAVVAERLDAARTVAEPTRIARTLMQTTWPEEGLVHDLPAADMDAVARSCDAMIAGLGPEALLRGEGVRPQVEARLRTFVRDLDAGLAPGIDPRDEHGDPIRAAAPWILIGPRSLGAALARDLADHAGEPVGIWGDVDVPWVVALATWPALDVAQVRRGTGGAA